MRARGRGGGGRDERFESSAHSAHRFAVAGPWPGLLKPRFPGRGAAGPHLLAARAEDPGPTRSGWRLHRARRARGLLRDAVAVVRTEKSSRAAVGTGPRLTTRRAPGSAQGGAKEKVRPGPWQSRRGSSSLWASRVPGRPCAGGSERGQVRKGGGSQSGGWEAPAPGDPSELPESQRSAGHHAGHHLGINFRTTVPSAGKSLHVASPAAAAVLPAPTLPLIPGSRVGAGPRPLLRPLPGSGSPSSEPGWRTPKAVL